MHRSYTSISSRDSKLVEMLHQNDKSAFNVLYQQYWGCLLEFAGNYIDDRDTCKEIVQELFIKLHSRHAQLRINVSLSSYLYTALRHKIFNYLRDRSVYRRHIRLASRHQHYAYYTNSTNNNVEQFMDAMELTRKVSDCLNRMPSKYREVYVLHKQQQYTLKKTSEILQRPVATIEKQLRKAVHILRDHILYN